MSSIRTKVVALLLALGLLTSTGCGRMAPFVARTIVAAAVVATVVAAHDAHMHHHHCGHRSIIIDDHTVYHYQGRWEYYDPSTDTWYEYEDIEVIE